MPKLYSGVNMFSPISVAVRILLYHITHESVPGPATHLKSAKSVFFFFNFFLSLCLVLQFAEYWELGGVKYGLLYNLKCMHPNLTGNDTANNSMGLQLL